MSSRTLGVGKKLEAACVGSKGEGGKPSQSHEVKERGRGDQRSEKVINEPRLKKILEKAQHLEHGFGLVSG